MILERFPEVQALDEDEKLLLAAEIFEQADAEGDGLTQEQRALLEERLKHYEAGPGNVVTHAQFIERFEAFKRAFNGRQSEPRRDA